MKVLLPGNQLFGFEGIWNCQNCGCRWEMEKNDPNPKRNSDQRDGDMFKMPCPTCHETAYRAIPMPLRHTR